MPVAAMDQLPLSLPVASLPLTCQQGSPVASLQSTYPNATGSTGSASLSHGITVTYKQEINTEWENKLTLMQRQEQPFAVFEQVGFPLFHDNKPPHQSDAEAQFFPSQTSRHSGMLLAL